MATQTTAGILERFEAVLQAPPCLLRPSANPFTDTAEPSVTIDVTYRLMAGGLAGEPMTTGYYADARLERIAVVLYKAMEFDAYQAQKDLQDLLDTVERAIIADGPDHGYMAYLEKGSGKVTRPKATDLCEATLNFLVDFDYTELAS